MNEFKEIIVESWGWSLSEFNLFAQMAEGT